MIWIFSILRDRAASLNITWYHCPCNIDITKYRFYMAAKIDKIVISELAATDPQIWNFDRYQFRDPRTNMGIAFLVFFQSRTRLAFSRQKLR